MPVFEIRQTAGRRVPRLQVSSRGRSRHVKTLEAAATRLGVAIEYGGVSSEDAAAESLGGRIRVRASLTGREKVRALAHELAHEVLHQAERAKALAAKRPPPRRTHAEVETEADATAYVVLGVLGVPARVPVYIAWQGGDGAQVLRSSGPGAAGGERNLGGRRAGAADPRTSRPRSARAHLNGARHCEVSETLVTTRIAGAAPACRPAARRPAPA